MKLLCTTAFAIVMAGAPLLLPAAEPNTGPMTFRASILVNVDATGKPIKVEAPQNLPEPIRKFVEQRVASWQYLPAKIGGVAQPATTYVSVDACAVPVAGGYKMGVDYHGNGPRTLNDRPLSPPMYPPLAYAARTEADFVLILDIDADGRAKIETFEKSKLSGRGGATEFEPVLRRWARTLRFEVEQLAGEPVPSKIRVPVRFWMQDRGTRSERINEFLTKANASPECQMAAASRDMNPVALDSVLKITPIPAG